MSEQAIAPVALVAEKRMGMYGLTLHKASAVTKAIFGNFSAPKAQEIIVARGKLLELLRPDDDTGRIQSILKWECFGIIRDIQPFRLTGGNRDYIVVGSDSGKITFLQFDAEKNRFVQIACEVFGKTGCRRIVPGQYLAVDPRGRSVIIGAVEKSKFVYILNRDSAANLIISSPLEAHKTNTICLGMTGLDVEFENPMYAALEINFEEDVEDDEDDDEMGSGEPIVHKSLTFYELDLGLNHVTRKHSEEVDPGANLLISVPGGNDGPGGLLVVAENWIIFQNIDHEEVRAPIPRRAGTPDEKGLLIVNYATHKQKDLFFFLLQSEYGDIYKVTLACEGDVVHDVHVKYFDTIPVASSICVLKTGYLYAASEFGNQYLFTFKGIGDDDDAPETSSETPLDEHVYFNPRKLRNLLLVDEAQSLAPVIDMKVADLAHEDTKQIYCLAGRGPRSSLRVLRHGLAVSEMAVSEVPGNPSAVWSVKTSTSNDFDSYIVVSFVNATLVLSIGDTVEEVSDSGFLNETPTVQVSLLGDDSLIQVHPEGIRVIRADKRINEWKPPGKKRITTSACNSKQVVIAMTGGEIAYFELDRYSQLVEVERKEMGHDVCSLTLQPIPQDRQRGQFLAVGLYDNTVRIISLDPNEPLVQRTMQALPALPNALCMQYMSSGDDGSDGKLFLYVGLANGVLVRNAVDKQSGELGDARKRFLGTLPVSMYRLTVHGQPAVMCLSSRSWLSYTYQGVAQMTPLSYEQLQYAHHFSSEQCPEGIVAISGRTLRIVTLEKLGSLFNQTSHSLRYTPRKMVVHPVTNHLIIIESDHNAFSHAEKEQIQEALKMVADEMDDEDDMQADDDEDDDDAPDTSEAFIGAPKAGAGKWGSCIRILDPTSGDTLSLIEMEDNEAAFSMCICEFHNRPGELFLIVGTAKDLLLSPRSATCGYIHVYRFCNEHRNVEFIHKTEVHDVPMAVQSFHGQLLAGVGKVLRLYDMGKKKLLRKCENKNLPTAIRSLEVQGRRIFIGDVAQAFHYAKYDKAKKQFFVFADQTSPRYLTSHCVLDYDTCAGGDKFGNFVITRLPVEAQDDEATPAHIKYGTKLNAAPRKLADLVQYYVGESITGIEKATLQAGGSEVILYSTVLGSIGVFIPFASREDSDFFQHLEMHLREHNKPILGREHLSFRSYYYPVKSCIDGDYCEQFTSLEPKLQKKIADELASDPAEITKKLEELRNRVL